MEQWASSGSIGLRGRVYTSRSRLSTTRSRRGPATRRRISTPPVLAESLAPYKFQGPHFQRLRHEGEASSLRTSEIEENAIVHPYNSGIATSYEVGMI